MNRSYKKVRSLFKKCLGENEYHGCSEKTEEDTPMKKTAILLALVMVLMIACVGCGSEEAATSEATVTEQPAVTYTIDYGESNTYTKDDMDAAIEKIMAEFNTWGCEMHEIRYSEELTGTVELFRVAGRLLVVDIVGVSVALLLRLHATERRRELLAEDVVGRSVEDKMMEVGGKYHAFRGFEHLGPVERGL